MNWYLLIIFVGLSLAMVVPGIREKPRRLQFPCLAGFAALLTVALPLAELNLHPELIGSYAVTRCSVMAILCLAATWVGYNTGGRWAMVRDVQHNPQRLAISAAALVVFGFLFAMKYVSTEITRNEEGAMSGISTIYLTLAKVMSYGFTLAAILYVRTKDWRFIPLLIPQLWGYISMFLAGRRSPTGDFIVIICLLLFFHRKWTPPFWMLGLGALLITVFSLNISEIRNTTGLPLAERIQLLTDSDPLKTLSMEGEAQGNRYVEIYNAAKYMEGRSAGGHYGFGLHFWNQLVFGFVPGQFVGKEFKDSLMFPLKDDSEFAGFEKSVGTCESGIAEAFMAFGYFGCFLFFLLGAFMRWAWEGAIRGGILHQLVLMLCTVQGLECFSLQLWTFVNLLATLALFVGPSLWWSRVRSGDAERIGKADRPKQGTPNARKRQTRRRAGLNPAGAAPSAAELSRGDGP